MSARLLLPLLLALAAPLHAQRASDRSEPFQTLSLSLSGQADLGSALDDSGYHRFWTPGPGLAIRASTPFYLGRAQAGIQFARHKGAVEFPDYLAMLGYGGLGPTLRLPGSVELEPALLAGILSMDFYGDEGLTLAVRRESELVIGASLHASAPLTERLRVHGGAQAVQVYTATRFRLASATLGLQWTLDTPSWLRRLLDS